MFRNPRENAHLSPECKLTPSVGRPPSPPAGSQGILKPPPPDSPHTSTPMASGTMELKAAAPPPSSSLRQTGLRSNGTKKPPTANGTSKVKGRPNGSILSFFKKSTISPGEDSSGLFLLEKGRSCAAAEPAAYREPTPQWLDDPDKENSLRFNEDGGSVKRQKLYLAGSTEGNGGIVKETEDPSCTPPPPDVAETPVKEGTEATISAIGQELKANRKVGPFVDESDSDEDLYSAGGAPRQVPYAKNAPQVPEEKPEANSERMNGVVPRHDSPQPPLLRHQTSNAGSSGDFEEFEGIEDFEAEEFGEGEEFDERRWMEEQTRLEAAEGLWEDGFEGDIPDSEMDSTGPNRRDEPKQHPDSVASACPICSTALTGVSAEDASVHVNNCLDGNPTPLPQRTADVTSTNVKKEVDPSPSKRFQRQVRAAKPGQENPFSLGHLGAGPASAFSKLMASHAEDAAWATASAAESAARGKPAYQRTCPFYKILPGFSICVDAFRYGAVEGCQAYFLSHFHSDHYIGLTSSWCHGPIFCSKVTANLVRQQLRVDPKLVIALEFEKTVEVPGTGGVEVTMIPANHCPGSSLFLFEKVVGKGKNPRKQRVLHCGDFRACRAHVEHPLLRPDLLDALGQKQGQQKIDVCYLDTTYLNPKYAFPSQEDVIKACADMCVSLSKGTVDESDGWEQMKKERAGSGMVKFVRKDSENIKQEGETEERPGAAPDSPAPSKKSRGRLLVVVGTYSIGKERICLGIAKALDSKIYAPPGKQRICACLEDPELDARLTNDPRAAQVHMTPLFEIRAETLDDYLKDYRDTFSRAVGFRPSGWNYKPPNSRFVESPSVQTVLRSQNWKSSYSMRELVPQRGSTSRASCFGVPYSEHSSFRELTIFCCALRIDKIIPTVNVGSAKSREKMKGWCEKWAMEKKKSGLFKIGEISDGIW